MFSHYARRPLPAQRQEQRFEVPAGVVRVPRVDGAEEVVDGREFVAAGGGQLLPARKAARYRLIVSMTRSPSS